MLFVNSKLCPKVLFANSKCEYLSCFCTII